MKKLIKNIDYLESENCKMYIIPNTFAPKDYKEYFINKSNPDEKYAGLYILIGDKNQFYIGHTIDPIERIEKHKSDSNHKKEFSWKKALVFVYEDTDNPEIHLDGIDVQYLEFLSFITAYNNNYRKNKKGADPVYIKPAECQLMNDFFLQIIKLTNYISLSIFSSQKANKLFE